MAAPAATSKQVRPRTLVVANRLPYPVDDGWKQRSFHVIRGLARASDLTLVIFHGEGREELDDFEKALGQKVRIVPVAPVRRNTPLQVLLGLVTRTPLFVRNERSREMGEAIRTLRQEGDFEVAVVEVASLFPYIADLPAGVRKIIDTHNIDSLVYRRYADRMSGLRGLYARLMARKLERFESEVFCEADLIWVCSEPEVPLAEQISPTASVQVIPNGVDALGTEVSPPPAGSRNLVFCGRMDYYPNVDAVQFLAQDVMPRVRHRIPDAELWVVGQSPSPEVVEAGEAHEWLHVTGRVESVEPYLRDAGAVVVPLRVGGGTRLKILEALALGKGMVSTQVGAEGIAVEHEEHILLADDPEAFAEAAVLLMEDPALATRIGAQGRSLVERRYDWTVVEADLLRSSGLGTSPRTA